MSRDTLFSGKLHCLQHEHGYRFSVDAVLLAHFISPKTNDRILDIGAGCGIVSLILAYCRPRTTLVSLELQAALLELIKKNIALNNYQDRMEAVSGDMRRIKCLLPAGSFDWVVCNPPYRKQGTGRLNPASEQAIARHEIKSTISDAARAAAHALKNRGRAAFIYPAIRGAALIAALKNNGLEPKRLQSVYSYPGACAKLLLVEAVKNGGEELHILPPFHIYRSIGGEYSEEMARCYQR